MSAWSDRDQLVCLGISLWNGVDPILKERPFGLSNPQGNHGEDVEECFWSCDNTPTHSSARTAYASVGDQGPVGTAPGAPGPRRRRRRRTRR